jgi:CDP-glucose 4,6-dehydratase
MVNKFWRGKRVLITGYEGFLGSNLTKELLNTQAQITGVDIKTGRKGPILSSSDYTKLRPIKLDISDYNALKKIIEKYRIEIIFHLAARALVGDCYLNPQRAFVDNITGTWNVLEAARNSKGVKAIVIASSDKAYGDHATLPYLEDAPLCGRNPYDVSKSCADLLAYSYYHSFGLPVVVTRCGNIFGPGDLNFCRIVPDAIRSAICGKPVLIRSNGRFTRDYVYVNDIINGYILLAERLEKDKLSGEAFNFSNENPLSVLSLVKKIYRMAGEKEQYKILDQVKHEIKDQYLCAEKARKVLGWEPLFSLEDGLKITIEWYRKYLSKGRK